MEWSSWWNPEFKGTYKKKYKLTEKKDLRKVEKEIIKELFDNKIVIYNIVIRRY